MDNGDDLDNNSPQMEINSDSFNGDIYDQRKRSLSKSATPSPAPKKKRTEIASSIRSALEYTQPRGILLYFKKATVEENHTFLARMSEEIEQHAEEDKWKADLAREVAN